MCFRRGCSVGRRWGEEINRLRFLSAYFIFILVRYIQLLWYYYCC